MGAKARVPRKREPRAKSDRHASLLAHERRMKELESLGYDFSHAAERAWFEGVIDQWPADWGDHLPALVAGDFDPPSAEVSFDSLGITIEPEKREGTVMRAARTVLKTRVTVPTKTLAGVKDAIRRLNPILTAPPAGFP